MHALGFEVRHVEGLRDHYALMLRASVGNLERYWDACVNEAGEARARIWRLYMAASALNFKAGRTQITRCWRRSVTEGSAGFPYDLGSDAEAAQARSCGGLALAHPCSHMQRPPTVSVTPRAYPRVWRLGLPLASLHPRAPRLQLGPRCFR
jgi:hypothetical protein